jgi:hypothetical protein
MMTVEIRTRIFQTLKNQPKQTLLEILRGMQREFPPGDIIRVLEDLDRSRYLEITDDGVVTLRIVLDPARKSSDSGKWNYDTIPKVPLSAAAGEIPKVYVNPLAHLLPCRGQGATGSCVGQSVAYGRDLDYMRLLDYIPSDEDMAHVQFNVPFGDQTETFPNYYDIYYPWSFSAAWIYEKSRKHCGIQNPAGSYVSCAVESLFLEGACFNDQWYVLKNGRARFYDPYPDTCPISKESAVKTAGQHKIDGYAKVTSETAVKQAILQHGYVVASIELFENYLDCKDDGWFRTPRGWSVGGHALCLVGWNENGYICLHSWRDEGFPKFGGIKYDYFRQHLLDCFTVLDQEEVMLAKGVYRLLLIEATTPSTIWVDGEVVGKSPVAVELRTGTTHLVRAEPVVGDAMEIELDPEDVGETGCYVFRFPEIKQEPEKQSIVSRTFYRFLQWLVSLF